MKRTLLRNISLFARNHLLSPPPCNSSPNSPLTPLVASIPSKLSLSLRLYSSENESSNENTDPVPETSLSKPKMEDNSIEDVSNKEFKMRIEKYFEGDEEALPPIMEAILRRKLAGKHEETDDELMDELRMEPVEDVDEKDVEADFDKLYKTDEEIDNLYDAKQIVMERMERDGPLNMDDKQWDKIVENAIQSGVMKDTKECEDIIEDMLHWDKLLPDDIKRKVEEKFNELGDRSERGELEPEEAYKLFKEFEDTTVNEYLKMMEEAERPDDETCEQDNGMDSDDPPGEGPILRWETRVVFRPGPDSWHPKNRHVKLSVTVKELDLSKQQFRRLKELAGKRYNPGKDELTITSERFEHREENRKDCLRTLLSIIEEAGKAGKLADNARASYVKERLRANPAFMERLRKKCSKLQLSDPSLPA